MRIAAGLALLLAGCARPVPVPGAAPRVHPAIVSLNPCSDAVLAEVSDRRQVLALSHYSRDPAATSMDIAVARRFGSVSDAAEETIALRPDVVVASPYLAPATRQAFADAGIRVELVPAASSVAESREQVMRIARIARRDRQGAALVARIDAAMDRARPPAGWRPVPALVWQSGGIVPGRETLIADLLRRTGFADAAALRGLRQADMLPLEALIADPPKLLLVAGNSTSGEDRMLSHPALRQVRGMRRERLDPALLWCGGPTIERAAARLAQVRDAG